MAKQDQSIALSELQTLTGGDVDVNVYETVTRAREIIKAAKICRICNEQVTEAEKVLNEAKRRQEHAAMRFGELIATAK